VRLVRHALTLETTTPIAFVDLSDRVRDWVATAGIRDGLLVVGTLHTTARIAINEREPKLQGDMTRFLERLAPKGAGYAHDHGALDGRDNGHAHLLSLFLNTTETIPVVRGELELGTWQAVFFVELDGPRPQREVRLTLLGESPAER